MLFKSGHMKLEREMAKHHYEDYVSLLLLSQQAASTKVMPNDLWAPVPRTGDVWCPGAPTEAGQC